MARRTSVSSVNSVKRLGKPFEYDPEFKGPRDRRGCTDILCLGLFIVFLVCWGILGFYAYRYGDPNRILQPTDYSGQKCGVDAGVVSKPYLIFFDPSLCARPSANVLVSGCSSPSVCVERCPTEEFYAPNYYTERSLSGHTPICLPKVNPQTGPELKEAVANNKCAKWYMKSIALGKYCVPDILNMNLDAPLQIDGQPIAGTTLKDVVKGANIVMALQKAYEAGEKVVSDAVASYPFILGGLAGAMVLSFVYILLLRWVTSVIVWCSILFVLVAIAVGLYMCYTVWDHLNRGGSGVVWNEAPVELRTWLDDPTTWLAFMIILAVILGVLLLMVVFLRKRISLAVTLIEEGGKAVSSITATLFFPVVPWVLQVVVAAYTGVVVLYLATSGEAIYKTQGMDFKGQCTCSAIPIELNGQICTPSEFDHLCANCVAKGAACQFFRYNPPDYTKWLHVFNIFGAIWTLFFISGMAQMILSATFASWYWTFQKSNVPFFVLTRSFFVSITYHSGTVAFGSLIISIVRFIRLVLDFIEKQANKYSDNAVAKCLMCFCKCCFACVEGFLKFISRNAYIMCAIHGKNFCASAKDAFNLLMRNVIRVVVIDKIMDFVFFMGKLLITALVCAALHFSLVQWPQNLNYNAVPITITGIGAFLIASVFFGVYSVAVDTLFLCFLEDCERNDGSAAKPYYMSPSLMRIFGKKNRARSD